MSKAKNEAEEDKKESVEKAGDEDDDTIWVNDFDNNSAKEFTEKLFKQSAKDPKRPLVIYIDSDGGFVDALSTMVTAMDAVPNKLITVCMGRAVSCGAMLFSHGDVRYVSPHSRIMIHEVSAGAFGNVNDMKVSIDEIRSTNEYWMGWLAKNCGKALKAFLKLFTNKRRDVWMNAEEAVTFGIADKIGTPKLKKVARYEVE